MCIRDRDSTDKRVKPLQLSPYGEALVRQWLESHLSALDRMDGGSRVSVLAADSHLFTRIHPLVIRKLVFDPAWAEPPASVDLFVRTESGSNILHELICRLPTGSESVTWPICVGRLHASEVSKRHTLSRGHVQRVFSRARAEGLLVWSLPGNQGDLSVSGTLLRDYACWQRVKFGAISDSYDVCRGTKPLENPLPSV